MSISEKSGFDSSDWEVGWWTTIAIAVPDGVLRLTPTRSPLLSSKRSTASSTSFTFSRPMNVKWGPAVTPIRSGSLEAKLGYGKED